MKSYWPTVIALIVFHLDLEIREDPSETDPIKRWIRSVEDLSEKLLSMEEVSAPLKSLVLHASKSGDLVLNLNEWLIKTVDQVSEAPLAFLLDLWAKIEDFMAHLDSQPMWPRVTEEVARYTQLEVSEVRDYALDFDAGFARVTGINVTKAIQWTFDVTVQSWVLRFHIFRFLWSVQNQILRIGYDYLLLIFQQVALVLDSEELHDDLTSFEVLEGVSRGFRYLRDTFLFRKQRRTVPDNFLQLDPNKGFFYNLERAVTNYIWLITTTIADVIRWTIGVNSTHSNQL